MNLDDVFYGNVNEEILTYTEKDEAIERLIDSMASPIPKTLELVKYRRVRIAEPKDSQVDDILVTVLEIIDENYGDPEEPYSEPNDEMRAAAVEFINKLQELYTPWACEIESSEVIDCEEWVKKNAPEWLEDSELTFVGQQENNIK